jgi:hypothetical protein
MPEDGLSFVRFCRRLLSLLAPALHPPHSMSAPPRATTFTSFPFSSTRNIVPPLTSPRAPVLSDVPMYDSKSRAFLPCLGLSACSTSSTHPAVGCSRFTLYIYVVAQALESACVLCVRVYACSHIRLPFGIYVAFARVLHLHDESL